MWTKKCWRAIAGLCRRAMLHILNGLNQAFVTIQLDASVSTGSTKKVQVTGPPDDLHLG
jgi:hypothetical protein